jgi:hypothetical protein
MPDGIYFNGKFTRVPGVFSNVSTTGLASPNLNNPVVVAIVGQGLGGQPGVPLTFITPSDAVVTLRGGDLLTGVLRAFTPSNTQPGASQVIAVRVDPAVQATTTLKDTNSANSVVITSINYGANDNLDSIQVSAGTISGLKATISGVYNGVAVSFVRDNLGDNAFTLKYDGSGATAATVQVSNGVLTTTITGDANTAPLDITLSQYPTVAAVVNFINAQHGYIATITTAHPNETPVLDGVATAQSILTTAYQLTANLQAFVNGVNGSQPLVSAAIASGASLPPATTATAVYLTGGADIGNKHLDGTSNSGFTVTTANDWTPAFNALSSTNAFLIAAMSSDPTVWAALQSFITTNSTTSLPRRGYVGEALGKYSIGLTNYTTDTAAINYDRMVFAAQGFTDNDDITRSPTTYPPYIMAAVLAGLQSGQPVGNSITNRDIRALSLEWTPSSSDLETAIANGICVIGSDPNLGILRVVRGISTWLQDNNFYRTEVSTGIALDTAMQIWAGALQPLKGLPGSPDFLARVVSVSDSALTIATNAGALIGDSNNPPYSNLIAKASGDATTVTAILQPPVPQNFLLLQVQTTVFQGSVTASVVGTPVPGQ